MHADSRFPERPTHPDFAILSEEVIANDSLADIDPTMVGAIIANYVDLDSFRYMAANRAAMFADAMGVTDEKVKRIISAAICDGFALGCAFTRRKAAT